MPMPPNFAPPILLLLLVLLIALAPMVGECFQIVSPPSLVAALPYGGIPDLQLFLVSGMPVAPETPTAAEVVFATPWVPESCTPLNSAASVAGKIFFMLGLPATGTPACTSKDKVLVGQRLGAIAVVVVNAVTANFGVPLFSFPDPFLEKRIPAYLMDQTHGFLIKASLDAGLRVSVSFYQAPLVVEERRILRSFYNSAAGPTWVYIIPGVMASTWGALAALPEDQVATTQIEPCRSNFPGLYCSPDGRLHVLGFTDQKMVKTFPTALLGLTRLRVMSLVNAGFEGAFPDISPLTQLYSVDFSGSAFSGTLPAGMANLTQLRSLKLPNHALGGPLPSQIIASWGQLQTLDLSFSALEGSLPAFGAWSRRLGSLLIAGNKFTGPVDPLISAGAPLLTAIDLSDNSFSGPLPNFSGLAALRSFRARNNAFTGPVPALAGLPVLDTLDLSGNLLSGQGSLINLSALPSLKVLNLAGNQLSGALPNSLPLTVVFLDLSRNAFTATSSFAAFAALKRFSVAYNPLEGDVNSRLVRLLPVSSDATRGLEELDFSGTRLNSFQTGSAPTIFAGPFTALRVMRGQANLNLTGRLLIQADQTIYPNLEVIDFANCTNLNSTLPVGIPSLPSLTTVDFRGTAVIGVEGSTDIPAWVRADRAVSAFDPARNHWCPALFGRKVPFALRVDPTFYNYTLCQCDKGYRRANTGECVPCPEGVTVCPGFDQQALMIAKKGYYLTPADDPRFAVRCFEDAISASACNPKGAAVFECGGGFEGRLCSQCKPNHFQRNRQCQRCDPFGSLLTAVCIIVVLLGIVFILWRVGALGYEGLSKFHDRSRINYTVATSARGPGGDDPDRLARTIAELDEVEWSMPPSKHVSLLTLLNILISYFQTIGIALDGIQLPGSLAVLSSIYQLAAPSIGEFGFECSAKGMTFKQRYLFTWLFPIAVMIFVWVPTAALVLARRSRGKTWRAILHNAIGLDLLVLNFFYFPMAKSTLGKYRCDRDPGDGVWYFAEAPATRCDALSFADKIVPLIIYPALGMALLVGIGLYGGAKGVITRARYWRWFGWFFAGFKPNFWPAPLILVQRKLILAIITSVASPLDSFRYTSIIGVLTGSMAFVMFFRPYKFLVATRIDAAATFATVLIYGSSIVLANPEYSRHKNALSAVTFAIHMAIMAGFVATFAIYIREVKRHRDARSAGAKTNRVSPYNPGDTPETRALTHHQGDHSPKAVTEPEEP